MAYLIVVHINATCPQIWHRGELAGCAAKIRMHCMDLVHQGIAQEVSSLSSEDMNQLIDSLQEYTEW
jgi:hypothetical protein